jgi:hypothetical protein
LAALAAPTMPAARGLRSFAVESFLRPRLFHGRAPFAPSTSHFSALFSAPRETLSSPYRFLLPVCVAGSQTSPEKLRSGGARSASRF